MVVKPAKLPCFHNLPLLKYSWATQSSAEFVFHHGQDPAFAD